MNFNGFRPGRYFWGALVVMFLTAFAPAARANVYATDVRVNGGFTNLALPSGTGATVSYILNEPATLGVSVNILLNGSSVRTLSIPAGSPGTLRGTNAVVWDGLGANSNELQGGTYSVSVTAAASGYTNWTQTSVDTNLGNYVWLGLGVAVDRNTNSPHYGRVFVANSELNQNGTNVGDGLGILKLNADGSPADESPTNWLSTGGYGWQSDQLSPWKLAVSVDDNVYVDDLSSQGLIYRWDPTVSTNSQLAVLRSDNWANGSVNLSGPALFGSGTNTEVWMADSRVWLGYEPNPPSMGLVRFNVTINGTCASNYTGVSVVGVNGDGSGTNLDESPFMVAVDKKHNLYTIQNLDSGDGSQSVFCFPAYDPSTNGGAPEVTPIWSAGGGADSYVGAYGMAVDSTASYVAVAFNPFELGFNTNGNVRVLSATNGALLADLDLDTNTVPYGDTDCAWDAVGNVYFIRTYFDASTPGFWRVMSPPGTNQATTMALASLQVAGPTNLTPEITAISTSNGIVTIIFTAGSGNSPSDFVVQATDSLDGSFTTVAATITTISPGVFEATLPKDGSQQFYQVVLASTITVPVITSQPSGQIVWQGSSVSFAVTAFGKGPFSYQWFFNGNILTNDVISTVAGTGGASYSGDGGPATSATMWNPAGVALDAAGNIFVADNANNRIRRVGTNGVITTLVGTGANGGSGDGGPATNATLDNPAAVALDSAGNLYLADQNCRIRKVDTNGIITTIAGNGANAYSGDGGPATNASISTPPGLALDAAGNLYLADVGNQRVRKVSTNGIITTVAGNGTVGYGGDGVQATNTGVSLPYGVAIDTGGNLFIADYFNNRIREVDTNGIISTVAGTNTAGFSGDGGPATLASLDRPCSVAVDAAGDFYFSDSQTNRVRKVDPAGIITTFAGNSQISFSGDGGPATNAALNFPVGLAEDPAGNLFIVDSSHNRIRKVTNTQGPTLALNDATQGNAGSYQVVVTGSGGTVTSSVANLTIFFGPIVSHAARLANGSLAMTFLSLPNSTNVVLYTTSLSPPITWQPLSTNVAGTDGQWQYMDTNTAGSQGRFYRSLMH